MAEKSHISFILEHQKLKAHSQQKEQWAWKLSQIFPPTSPNAHPAYAKASEYAVYS